MLEEKLKDKNNKGFIVLVTVALLIVVTVATSGGGNKGKLRAAGGSAEDAFFCQDLITGNLEIRNGLGDLVPGNLNAVADLRIWQELGLEIGGDMFGLLPAEGQAGVSLPGCAFAGSQDQVDVLVNNGETITDFIKSIHDPSRYPWSWVANYEAQCKALLAGKNSYEIKKAGLKALAASAITLPSAKLMADNLLWLYNNCGSLFTDVVGVPGFKDGLRLYESSAVSDNVFDPKSLLAQFFPTTPIPSVSPAPITVPPQIITPLPGVTVPVGPLTPVIGKVCNSDLGCDAAKARFCGAPDNLGVKRCVGDGTMPCEFFNKHEAACKSLSLKNKGCVWEGTFGSFALNLCVDKTKDCAGVPSYLGSSSCDDEEVNNQSCNAMDFNWEGEAIEYKLSDLVGGGGCDNNSDCDLGHACVDGGLSTSRCVLF